MIIEGMRKKKILVRFFIILCLLFVFLVLTGVFFLKKGIQVEQFSLGGITASEASIIWNKKLDLEIAKITIDKKEEASTEKTENNVTSLIGKGIESGYYLLKVFSKFHIQNLQIANTSIEIGLFPKDTHSQIFSIKSDDISFVSDLIVEKQNLTIQITKATSSRFNSGLTGTMQLDGKRGVLSGELFALINKKFPAEIAFTANDKALSFSGKEAGEITEINSLVDLFGLRHGIQRWITDYLKGSRYHLKSFNGTVPWDNPKEILNTLEAEVTVDATEYTFAPGLEPIKASYTDVSFKKGVLDILPHEAMFYGQDCGTSWVDINFNDPKNILLTAYIKTTAVANDDIINLLGYYKIPFPFKQVGGKTKTDLELAIILNKKKLEANGSFEIAEGVIDWGGKNFSVEDALIQLATTDITIDRLSVTYDDIATAQVSGTVAAKKKTGDLDIGLEMLDLHVGDSTLTIDKNNPLKAAYHFAPSGHILRTQPSSWLLDTLPIQLGALNSPFDYNNLSLKIDKVPLGLPSKIESEISGEFSLKHQKADFSCDLLTFNAKAFELISPHILFDIKFDNGLYISTEEVAEWELSKMPITFFPSTIEYKEATLSVVSSRLSYGDLFDSYLAGYFDMKAKSGRFSLNKIDLMSENLKQRLTLGKNVDIEVNGKDGDYVIFFPLFDLNITTDKEKNWSAKFGDLSAVYPRSKILQKYNIKEGKIEVSSVNGKRPYTFKAEIKAPYPLLVEDDTVLELLRIKGQLTDDGTFATLNEDVEVHFADHKLNINSHKLGYNLPAILKLIEELPERSSKQETVQEEAAPFTLRMSAENSHIFLTPNSRILADNLELKLLNGTLGMELEHGKGLLSLQLEEGSFMLNGRDLNDTFMGALIHSSTFQGGAMSVAAMGMLKEFSAVFEIDDTLLLELSTVNNIMAFLNTVPALVTFSLPEYDTTGFPVDSAIVGMKLKDKVMNIESLEVFSPVMYAKGKGLIDFSTKIIDMDISLKTQAGRNVGKIPVLGYVLAGKEDDESLNVKIQGHLDDPDVDHSLVQDIVVLPAEILYRTLKLPFHLGSKFLPESTAPAGENKPDKDN
jgi:hypothetical protein